MSWQLAVSSTLKKVPGWGLIERNCWIKALNLVLVMPKPASAQAPKPPSMGKVLLTHNRCHLNNLMYRLYPHYSSHNGV
ncbi:MULTISPECIES: hypothetical protein [Nostoc]|uniref:Uncharacterized protein n=1 Tax=Nostoc punctiforme FACHB-252 TaxID=1357509 RepID=A0ABR8HK29_NOSPU|nr:MULTISPECIES: hypothetical protein [Nostoc]MBC1237356.1 hypothetical protein [Nostoc sp. 2RC]MBD2615932.1 hypothetical protein [Nostoc punctiforme FACHB-252]